MSQETQADALARWLDGHPGQEPPPDIDPEVVQAVYALRPDLAPPPRVALDDILAGVTAGPFANAAQPVAPSPEGMHSVASPKLGRRWVIGGVGTLLAAALATLVVLPALRSSSEPDAQLAYTAEEFAPIPALDNVAPTESFGAMPELEKLADAKPTDAPTDRALGDDLLLAKKPSSTTAGAGSRNARTDLDAVADLYDEEEEMDEDLELAQERDQSQDASVKELGYAQGRAAASPPPNPRAEVSPATETLYESDIEATADESRVAEITTTYSNKQQPKKKAKQDRDKAREGRRSRATASNSWVEPSVAEPAMSGAEESLASLAARAQPTDYASSDAATKDLERASAIQVAQDHLIAGKNAEAERAAKVGIDRSTANTPALSMLHFLRGEALRLLGDSDGARRAYQRAIELNGQR